MDIQSAEYFNVVDPVQLELWIPTLGFHNTEAKQSTVSDADSSINIIKEGNYSLSSLSSLENAEEYRGAENKINLTRTYDIHFICNYHLFWYPFDEQVIDSNISPMTTFPVNADARKEKLISNAPI